MARVLFGGTSGDYTLDPSGQIVPNAGPIPVYDARTGGTQVTDLLTVAGTPVATLTSDNSGLVLCYAPDGWTAPLWLESTPGTSRVAMRPVELVAVTPDGVPVSAPVTVTNDDKALSGLVINRTDASTDVNDADILEVQYLGTRAFWTNEVGMPRAQLPEGKTSEIAFKLIAASTGFGNDI